LDSGGQARHPVPSFLYTAVAAAGKKADGAAARLALDVVKPLLTLIMSSWEVMLSKGQGN
jgi:hypothetical protein